MDIITAVENGINIVFGIKAEKIYLLHPLVINFFKAIYQIVQIENPAFWLVTLFVAGVIIPLIYAMLANKYKLLEAPFKPRKYITKK